MMTLTEALRWIRMPELTQSGDKVMAAHTLRDKYSQNARFTLADMLRCLDHAGTIAACGARCLYKRTGRKEEKFITDRWDWENYLATTPRIPARH